jgi:hypothetical protein
MKVLYGKYKLFIELLDDLGLFIDKKVIVVARSTDPNGAVVMTTDC